MEVALDSIDSEAIQIEEDARSIRASEIVKQFKLEMGLGEVAAATEEPQLEVPEREAEQGEKTLGKERTRSE